MLKKMKQQKKQNKAKQKSSQSNPAQSFFLILIFAIGGFVVIMMGTMHLQNAEVATNENYNPTELELETLAKNIVLNSSTFKEYGDGLLIHENKQKLGCDTCFEFTFKFNVQENTNAPQNIESFKYKIVIMRGDVKLIEVDEIIKK